MTNFEYTHTREVSSSAVDEIHYNANTKELAVDLDDSIYVYSNVPLDVYENLVRSQSVGRAFVEVKRQYGPSKFLGHYDYVEYVKVGFDAPSMAAVGTPKNLTYAEGAVVTAPSTTNPSDFRLTLGHQPVATAASTPTVSEIFRDHRVLFNVEGMIGLRTYNVKAGSVEGAVKALEEATSALGLTVNVKEVTVQFE